MGRCDRQIVPAAPTSPGLAGRGGLVHGAGLCGHCPFQVRSRASPGRGAAIRRHGGSASCQPDTCKSRASRARQSDRRAVGAPRRCAAACGRYFARAMERACPQWARCKCRPRTGSRSGGRTFLPSDWTTRMSACHYPTLLFVEEWLVASMSSAREKQQIDKVRDGALSMQVGNENEGSISGMVGVADADMYIIKKHAIYRVLLGRVDKTDSQSLLGVIQAGICDGDQLGTRPDVGRGMGVL